MLINYTNADGNSVKGKKIAIICFGCHGRTGNSTNPEYPILAEQGAPYLIKQLLNFKNGLRKEQHMSSMVEAITKSDIPHLAAYFSQQTRKAVNITKKNTETGKKIFNSGIQSKGIPACATCHGIKGRGLIPAKFPSLAGQHADYIKKALNDFRNNIRHNDPQKMMRNIAKNLSNDEIRTISKYISRMNSISRE
jgi:cytochrome c553